MDHIFLEFTGIQLILQTETSRTNDGILSDCCCCGDGLRHNSSRQSYAYVTVKLRLLHQDRTNACFCWLDRWEHIASDTWIKIGAYNNFGRDQKFESHDELSHQIIARPIRGQEMEEIRLNVTKSTNKRWYW